MTERQTTSEKPGAETSSGTQEGGRWAQAVLTFLVLVVGVVALMLFLKFRKSPQREEQAPSAPLVQVRTLAASDVQMVIEGYGTVRPKVQVQIIPEVAGKVVFVHSELKAGGIIPAHEKIVQIDPRDYELAVQQAEATVAEAQVRLDTEVAEAEVARREWRQLHPETEPGSSLVLREPQIKQAQAGLESAKAQLSIAELRLERTTISLPFEVMIASETIDLGQYVGIGQSLATAYGTDAFEIEVPLEDRDLAWFDVLRSSVALGNDTQPRNQVVAEVQADFAGRSQTWTGHVTRTTGQVDPQSRMVPVVIEVPKPLETAGGKPPLLPGAFVKVLIAGKMLKDALAVPRDAIRGQNSVWMVDNGRLQIVELDIVRADREFAYVTSGLSEGAAIVTSALDAVVDQMAVRIPDKTGSEESGEEPIPTEGAAGEE